MIRIRDEPFFEARKRAISKGLIESFADSPLRPDLDPSTGDVVVDDPKGRRSRFAFDRRGFVGKVVSPMGRRWEIEADAQGRPRSFADPAGLRLELDYDPAGHVDRVGREGRTACWIDRDPFGRIVAYRYPDGTSTRIDRGSDDRVRSMVDRLGVIRTFEHGPDGLLSAMTDGRGHQTRFDYEALDRPGRLTFPDGSTESYEYDPSGQVRAITSGDGTRVVIARDSAGRPLRIDAGGSDVSRFEYDEGGQLVLAENPTASVRFEYDEAGRLVAESQGSDVVRYDYDAASTLIALTYPTGERVEFGRDDDDRLVRVADWAGGTYRIEHAADDRWLTIRSPNGLITSVDLTVGGRVAEVVVRSPLRPSAGGGGPSGGEDLFATAYRYDDEDRLASASDSEHGERLYRYDAEGRVVEAGRGETFAYDPSGNRVRSGDEPARFDPADQLIGQGSIGCDYDLRGNLIGWSEPVETWRFDYDSRNRMTRALSRSGRVVTFGYDALGRRVWKQSEGVITRFFWAGEQLLREVRSDGPSRDYLYPPGSPTPLAIRDRGVIYTVHADHLGTPRRLTDPRGLIAWSGDFDAFGNAKISGSALANPIRFPGHYYDDETGLHYNRFRYYSPRLGRYLSRDPASYLGGLNLYAYAGNDPINTIDPMGLWPGWPSWRTVVPILAAVAVGVAVVMLAPVALPLAIILAGAAAGAVGAGLNQALNEKKFCAECIAKAALKGALVGAVAAVPFALLPATAGVAAFAGVGGLSGGISYTGNHLLNPGSPWSWKDFGESVVIGAGTAGAGRYLGGQYAQWRQGETPSANISTQVEGKILYGDRATNQNGVQTQRIVGGHSPDLVNQPDTLAYGKNANGDPVALPNPDAVKNPDGTQEVEFIKQYPDGTLSSNAKESTVAPDTWSNQKIMDTTQQVGDSPALGTRAHDGATWHRQTVDGVEWDVIKDSSGNVTSSYPTGGGAPPLGGFTPTPAYPVPPVAGPAAVGATSTAGQPGDPGGPSQ